MVDVAELVRAETSLDLTNPQLIETLAAQFGGRAAVVFGTIEKAKEVAGKLLTAYKTLTAANMTPLAVYTVALNIVSTAFNAVMKEAKAKAAENITRREQTRNEFISLYYPTGGWSQVYRAKKAPSAKNLDLSKGALQDALQHLKQYDPRELVWHVSRVARPQVLWPTFRVPPYDEPGNTPAIWQNGVRFDQGKVLQGGKVVFEGTLLGGFDNRSFLRGPPPTAPVPKQYVDKYWGGCPNCGSLDMNSGPGAWPWVGVDWNALDASVFIQGYAPVPDYHWLFSLGTYPYTTWTGGAWDNCGAAAALAVAIHSLSAFHAAIRYDDVVRCYKHFVQITGWRRLPIAPQKQVDSGLYLTRDTRLPWSPLFGLSIPLPGTEFPHDVVASIEESFRSFFRIRRAAVYQFEFCSDEFKGAAKQSPDPLLRALAHGAEPPPYKPWRFWDPLGEGWDLKEGGVKGAGPKPPGPGLGPKDTGAPAGPGDTIPAAGGGGAGALLLAAAAALGIGGIVLASQARTRRRK